MDNTAKAGTYTTMLSFLAGNFFHLDKTFQEDVMFWLQTGAFLISIVVGILTASYYIVKLKAAKRHEEEI